MAVGLRLCHRWILTVAALPQDDGRWTRIDTITFGLLSVLLRSVCSLLISVATNPVGWVRVPPSLFGLFAMRFSRSLFRNTVVAVVSMASLSVSAAMFAPSASAMPPRPVNDATPPSGHLRNGLAYYFERNPTTRDALRERFPLHDGGTHLIRDVLRRTGLTWWSDSLTDQDLVIALFGQESPEAARFVVTSAAAAQAAAAPSTESVSGSLPLSQPAARRVNAGHTGAVQRQTAQRRLAAGGDLTPEALSIELRSDWPRFVAFWYRYQELPNIARVRDFLRRGSKSVALYTNLTDTQLAQCVNGLKSPQVLSEFLDNHPSVRGRVIGEHRRGGVAGLRQFLASDGGYLRAFHALGDDQLLQAFHLGDGRQQAQPTIAVASVSPAVSATDSAAAAAVRPILQVGAGGVASDDDEGPNDASHQPQDSLQGPRGLQLTPQEWLTVLRRQDPSHFATMHAAWRAPRAATRPWLPTGCRSLSEDQVRHVMNSFLTPETLSSCLRSQWRTLKPLWHDYNRNRNLGTVRAQLAEGRDCLSQFVQLSDEQLHQAFQNAVSPSALVDYLSARPNLFGQMQSEYLRSGLRVVRDEFLSNGYLADCARRISDEQLRRVMSSAPSTQVQEPDKPRPGSCVSGTDSSLRPSPAATSRLSGSAATTLRSPSQYDLWPQADNTPLQDWRPPNSRNGNLSVDTPLGVPMAGPLAVADGARAAAAGSHPDNDSDGEEVLLPGELRVPAQNLLPRPDVPDWNESVDSTQQS